MLKIHAEVLGAFVVVEEKPKEDEREMISSVVNKHWWGRVHLKV